MKKGLVRELEYVLRCGEEEEMPKTEVHHIQGCRRSGEYSQRERRIDHLLAVEGRQFRSVSQHSSSVQ